MDRVALKRVLRGERAECHAPTPSCNALADLYRRYWNTPEDATIEIFRALHREIDILERQVGADTAWRTLEAAARAWYQEKGTCPFCKLSGVLHLATETV